MLSQVWTTVMASTALDDGVELTLEASGRFGDDADGLYELEFGGWLGFDAGDGVTISTGYVRVPGYSHGDLSTMEERPRQQISFPPGGSAGGTLSGRDSLQGGLRRHGAAKLGRTACTERVGQYV